MLVSLILGIVAGAAVAQAEPHVKSALDTVLPAAPGPGELRLYSFALCLFVAAILAALFGHSSGVALTLGGVLGVFGPRIIDLLTGRRAPDYGPDPE